MIGRHFLLAGFVSVCAMALLPGCPDNPYSSDTWIEQLDDPKEMERAVTELEHLCDPKAIPALGKAWERNNQPTRILQVIIDLSRKLTRTDASVTCGDQTSTDFCAQGANLDKSIVQDGPTCAERAKFCAAETANANAEPDAAKKQKLLDKVPKTTVPGAAEVAFCTDFVSKGRPASWDKALPFLQKALEDLDSNSQRSVDSAVKAAEALGDAQTAAIRDADEAALKQLADGNAVGALIDAVNKKMSVKDAGQRVRVGAIASLGKYKDASATNALAAVIKADKDSQPPALVGAAINALGEMHSEGSLPILIDAMYRQPFFFQQSQRALIGTGSGVKDQMRKILEGTHAEVNALVKEQKLDKWCGADGKLPGSECKAVAPVDYYAAMVVGGLYDEESVDVLLKALDRPATPSYYDNQGNPGPPPQNAILDALRKIGSPKAAEKVLSIYASPGPKGKPTDLNLRILAANVYGFVSPDGQEKFGGKTGLQLLVATASKNDEVEGLRLAAAESLGRLVTKAEDSEPLRALAAKYANASNEKRKEADGAPKTNLDKAQKDLDAANKVLAEADKELKKQTLEKGDIGLVDKEVAKKRGDAQKAVDFIKTCPEYDVKDKQAATKEAKDKAAGCGRYNDAKAKFDDLDSYAGFMKNFERGFEAHLARVEIAICCGGKPECLMKAFEAKPDDAFKAVKAQNSKPVTIKNAAGKDVSVVLFSDDKEWGEGDKADLYTAQIERAVLDLRRLGAPAAGQTSALLAKINDKAFMEDRLIRQAIMLALPRIAKVPCDECKTQLEKLAKAGQGKAELNALNYETQLVISYFTWAGKK